MKRKNILYYILFLFFCIFSSCPSLAKGGKKEYLLDMLSKCVPCLKRRSSTMEFDHEPHHEKKTDSAIIIEKSYLEELPTEVLHELFYWLSARDIFNISITSKNLLEKIDSNFWKNYLKIHKQERWNKSLPPIKVAFSYLLFEEGKTAEAAKLGLPDALAILKLEKQKKLSNKDYPKKDYYSSHKKNYHSSHNFHGAPSSAAAPFGGFYFK